MKIKKAYRFKLKPNPLQAEQLNAFCGCARFVWNKVWVWNRERLEKHQPLVWYGEADFYLKLWKRSDDYGFLKEAPSHCLQQKLRDLDKAYRDGFDKKQPHKRMPRLKKRGARDAIRFPDMKQVEIDNRRIKLPKLGWVGFFKSKAIQGEIRNVTVSREADGWYASIQVEQAMESPRHPATSIIGLDMGVERLVTCSDHRYYKPINSTRKYARKLAKAQRDLDRKKKFSANWRKQKARIGKIHRKIANCRYDRLHWISDKISKNHAIIVIEDLKVRNMTRSAKGTMDEPGSNVKAKSGLNRALLDQGFSMFRHMLEYKQQWRGGWVIPVDPRYTSQKCPCCGYRDKRNRPSQALFLCQDCGYTENADVVGVRNVLAAGYAAIACGESGLPGSVKQEPVGTRKVVPTRVELSVLESPSL